jgi:general secretion pathway protein A
VSHPHLHTLFGLKWNPFTGDVPVGALWRTPELDAFCWRLDGLVRDGGFALVTGDPGTGKSVALRLLAHHLAETPDTLVATLTRPQSSLADFYRELGDLFAVPLKPHNRWAGFKSLRQSWSAQMEASRYRPVLLLDEAQELLPPVLAELRILASAEFDSKHLLTVVLAGDHRLTRSFQRDDLLPIASRIRIRLTLGHLRPKQLLAVLQHALTQAGRPDLITPETQATLTEHAAGNLRVLAHMAHDLLAEAARRNLPQIDQKLYIELFAPPRR